MMDYALENIYAHSSRILKNTIISVISEMESYSAHPDTIPNISPVILYLEGKAVFGWTAGKKKKLLQSTPVVFYSIEHLCVDKSELNRTQYEHFLITSFQLQDFQKIYDNYYSIVKAVKSLS